MQFSTIEDVEQYLSGIPKFQSDHTKAADFNLRKFETFCDEIGNPQDRFPSVHVAGTNGKGSTCSTLEAIYREAGFSVGKFTSPHILHYRERFEVNGQLIPDDELIIFFRTHHQQIKEHSLTYFEISTAIAFWWFAKSEVDLGIIEVGLGGRLDATNIITPLVSVITSISLDHTAILGDTIEAVAREKGGIIKAGHPVVIGDLPGEAIEVIEEICREKEADLYPISSLQPEYSSRGVVKITVDGEELDFDTPLEAPVQALNLAIAWQVIQTLGKEFAVTPSQFRRATKTLNVGYGRFERLKSHQQWYFDGAHNIEAVRKFKDTVSSVGRIKEAILVLSLMADKIQPKVMEEFSEFKNIYYYSLNTERAASVDDITHWLPQVKAFPIHTNQQRQIFEQFDSELVIFAGSFYFYATVRDWVNKFA